MKLHPKNCSTLVDINNNFKLSLIEDSCHNFDLQAYAIFENREFYDLLQYPWVHDLRSYCQDITLRNLRFYHKKYYSEGDPRFTRITTQDWENSPFSLFDPCKKDRYVLTLTANEILDGLYLTFTSNGHPMYNTLSCYADSINGACQKMSVTMGCNYCYALSMRKVSAFFEQQMDIYRRS